MAAPRASAALTLSLSGAGRGRRQMTQPAAGAPRRLWFSSAAAAAASAGRRMAGSRGDPPCGGTERGKKGVAGVWALAVTPVFDPNLSLGSTLGSAEAKCWISTNFPRQWRQALSPRGGDGGAGLCVKAGRPGYTAGTPAPVTPGACDPGASAQRPVFGCVRAFLLPRKAPVGSSGLF